ERETFEERLEAERLVGEIVALADLDEATAHAKQVEALLEQRARQRVEHYVDALVVGPAEDVVDKPGGARVRDVFDALRAQPFPLLLASRGGVNFSADVARPLKRGNADTAGTGVDE